MRLIENLSYLNIVHFLGYVEDGHYEVARQTASSAHANLEPNLQNDNHWHSLIR